MKKIYTKEEVIEAVKLSKTYSDVFRNLGQPVNGGSYTWIKGLIKKHGADTSHFLNRSEIARYAANLRNIGKDDISSNVRRGGERLRSFMSSHGIDNKCGRCGLIEWMGEFIRLDVDHIDKDPLNNTIGNLEYLCPNCHRQKTHKEKVIIKKERIVKQKRESKKCVECNRDIRNESTRCYKCSIKHKPYKTKIDWPDDDILQDMIWKSPMIHISKELGVSDVAIRKRSKKLGLSIPPQGYWLKSPPSGI